MSIAVVTDEELNLLKSTWSQMENDLRGNGLKLFILFFNDFPSTFEKFPSFYGSSSEELKTNEKLIELGNTVMSAISALLGLLQTDSEAEVRIETLKNVAKMHKDKGISVVDVDNFGDSFMKFLSISLGDNCSEEVTATWIKVIKNIILKEFSEFLLEAIEAK